MVVKDKQKTKSVKRRSKSSKSKAKKAVNKPVSKSEAKVETKKTSVKTVKRVSRKKNNNAAIIWLLIIIAIVGVGLILYYGPKSNNGYASTKNNGQNSGSNSGSMINANTNKPINMNEVVASVNGDKITEGDVFNAMMTIPAVTRSRVTKPMIIDDLINQKLLVQEAENQGVTLNDSEFNTLFEQSLAKSNLTMDQLKDQLKKMQIDYDAFMANMKVAMLLQKYVKEFILPEMNVTVADEQSFYQQNKMFFGNKTFEDVEPQIKQLLENEKAKAYLNILMKQLRSKAKIIVNAPYDVPVCLINQGVTNKVLLYSTDNKNCVACQNMKKILDNLSVNYGIANSTCFQSILDKNGYAVPELFCRDGSYLIGNVTKKQVENFVSSCK